MAVVLTGSTQRFEQLRNINDPSQTAEFRGRLSENIAAFEMWRDHPVLGIGAGEFPANYRTYAAKIGLDARAERNAHNSYLQAAAETGTLGLLAFVGMIVTGLWCGLRARSRLLAMGLCARWTCTEALIAGLVGYLCAAVLLHQAFPEYLWARLGLLAGTLLLSGILVTPPRRPRRMSIARPVFWLSGAATAWVLVGYPATLSLLLRRPWDAGDDLPRVTVIIAAYREREELAEKLRALEDQGYPADRLQLIIAVVDDDEETAELARAARPDALVLFSKERGGKPAALNRGVAAAEGDVILMTDANNLLEPGSLVAALRHFSDPSISAVAGRRGEEKSAYDRYEGLIRSLETRTGSVAAMSGELMAVRREMLTPFPEDAVVHDLWLLCSLARQGGRAIYEPAAGSTEPAIGHKAEVARRSRVWAGRLQMASELRGLPWGFRWRVLSHKYGRLALPVLLPVVLLSSLAASRRQPDRAFALIQVAGYTLGLASIADVRPPGPAGTLARACGQFLLGNYSVGIGLVRGLRRAQSIRWDPVR